MLVPAALTTRPPAQHSKISDNVTFYPQVENFVSQLGFDKFSKIQFDSDDDAPKAKSDKAKRKRKASPKQTPVKPAGSVSETSPTDRTSAGKKKSSHHGPDGDRKMSHRAPVVTKQTARRATDAEDTSPQATKPSRRERRRRAKVGRSERVAHPEDAVQVDQVSSSTSRDTRAP